MNERTLDAYRQGWRQYIKNSPPAPRVWNDWLLHLARTAPKPILEIGSGSGRDAAYLEKHGHRVERTDAVHGFVAHMIGAGYDAKILNILEEQPTRKYGLILACAVLHHFTPREADTALGNITAALKPSGMFGCMVRRGTGHMTETRKTGHERHFWLYQPGELWNILDRHLETRIIRYEKDKGGQWLFAAARKR